MESVIKRSLLLILVFSFAIFPQKAGFVTDISPDGKTKHTYVKSEQKQQVFRTSQAPFGSAPSWTAGLERQISSLAFGDYDGDGDLDLAAGCYLSDSYPRISGYNNLIFRNDNGVLTLKPVWYSADSRSTTDIKWVDINGDGKPDLFSGNGDASYTPSAIYLNNGTGVPATPSFTFIGQAWTVGTAFGDINGDGLPDLVAGNQGNSSDPFKPVFYYINQGTGFTQTPTYTSNDGMITNSVAFADLDNSDLTRVLETFTVPGVGKGAFHLSKTPITKIHSVKVNGSPVADFCWDPVGAFISIGGGVPTGATVVVEYSHVKKGDIAAAKWGNFVSGVYMNSMGGVSGMPAWKAGNTLSQKGCAWADYDLDGYPDLLIGGNGNQHVLYRNNNGTLGSAPVWSSNLSPAPSTQQVLFCDVNNDGYPDITTVSFSPARVELYLNDAGTFASTPGWTYTGASSLNSIAYGDVNGDGLLDLAIGTARTPVIIFLNQLSPVPVQLLSFNAFVNGSMVELKWVTGTETNCRDFLVERRSENGKTWTIIGSLPGSGTTTSPVSYSFIDRNTGGLAGKVYYRLRQTDLDGTSHVQQPVEVEIDIPASFDVSVFFPNPVPLGSSKWLEFTLPEERKAILKVFNATGELILTQDEGVKRPVKYDIPVRLPDVSACVHSHILEFGSSAGGLIRQCRKFTIT